MPEPKTKAVKPETPIGGAGETRCGFIAILGATNAGKSTLVNALVGVKVSIVSHKVQTTRVPVRGIAIEGNSQLVFIDTPGIFNPKRKLDRAMVEAAWNGADAADAVVVLIDAAKGIDDATTEIFERLKNLKLPRIAVLNKVDRIEEKEKLLALTEHMSKLMTFDKVFMISALDGTGVQDLKSHLAAIVPAGPWHYNEDDVTDIPLRLLAAEITRDRRDDELENAEGRLGADRANHLRRARRPEEHCAWQGRRNHQTDFHGSAARHRRSRRPQGASVLIRQGSRELGQRSRALS